jgi:hypothetical protein
MQLLVLFGPPAVGKMTVGLELCRLTGYRLLHNHMTIEPVLDVFPFGSPPFNRLVREFRHRILEEACRARLAGLVFTYAWAVDDKPDVVAVSELVELVEKNGGTVCFAELSAELDTRLERNGTELRLDRKRSKRDLAFSHDNLLDLERRFVMNTHGRSTLADELLVNRRHVQLDNTRLSPTDAARALVAALGLPHK